MKHRDSQALWVRGMMHDCNNLLQSLLGSIQALKTASPPSKSRIILSDIQLASDYLAAWTRHLGGGKKGGSLRNAPVPVNRLLKEAVRLSRHSGKKECQVRMKLSTSLPKVEGDSVSLLHLFLNLCINAREAMRGKGRLFLSTAGCRWNSRNWVEIVIQDTGVGMDERTRKKIFDPDFSRKGRGRGMGLSSVQQMLRSHGGRIEVRSQKGSGTAFHIFLPVRQNGKVQSKAVSLAHGKRTVLLVDDDDLVRRSIHRMLQDGGYHVLESGSGWEAERIFKKYHAKVSLILLDYELDGMDGVETLESFRKIRPRVPVVFSSGHPRSHLGRRFNDLKGVEYLQKPFEASQLLSMVRDLMLLESGL